MTPEERLEEAIEGIRNEVAGRDTVEQAAERVWDKLSTHAPLRGCADFQALIPEYRAGALSEARALLLKDHTRECVACRKALEGTAPKVIPLRAPRRNFPYAIAAAVALTVGLSGWAVFSYLGSSPAGSAAVAQSVEGRLYGVSGQAVQPIAAGQELPAQSEVRTAMGSSAMLRLRDGSLVEMRERSGLSVSATRRDLTIHLDRGSVIVQAAKRRSGHLYVDARDCRISVTGTVFSVNSGVKGSRVSVIEGEVRVAQGRDEKVLHPGDQFSSSPSATPVPVKEEIAWSRNLDAHLALLRTFVALDKRLEQAHFPDIRYSSRLLDLLPEGTAIYASVPNLSKPLNEAQQLFRERVQDNADLRQWWEQNQLDDILTKMRSLSDYLGDEIVLAASLNARNRLGEPVILAELKRQGLPEFLSGIGWSKVPMVIRQDVMAISPGGGALEALNGGFKGTEFHSRISEAYREGAGLLFAADLERIVPPAEKAGPAPQLKYLVVEQRESAGKPETRAVISFAGSRTGIASWLAAPAPMGALDFVSPEAGFVSAAVVKSPAAILEQIFGWQPNLRRNLAELESRLGFSIQNDLAGPLGAEFAIALDGPALPVPSWKMIAEVYDPGRLQWAIQKLVETYNRDGRKPVQLTQKTAGGRIYYTLLIPEAKPFGEAHYVFADGYLVAAPNRALLDQAIQLRSTGYSLPRSPAFLSLVPRDGYLNFSAVAYQNVGPSLAPILESLNADKRLSSELKPTLVAAYGEEDRISVASSGSLLGLGLGNIGITQLLGTRPRPRAYR